MPDNDIFTRFVSRDWRPSTRCFHGDADAAELAPMLLRGLARSLKHAGGLPELPMLADLYKELLSGRIQVVDLLRRGREIQSEGSHSRHVRLAVRVLTRVAAQHAMHPMVLENPEMHYVTAFLGELIDHNVLDPSIPAIENLGKFTTVEERLAKASECRDAVLADGRMHRIADMLLADPSAANMRLPSSDRQRVSTAEILDLTVA